MVEAVEEVAGPQDLPHIVKGKRTKRQRPQSPIPFTITTQYSSSGEGGYVSNGDNCINNVNNNTNNNNNHNNSSSSSAEEARPDDHASNEEDEYTAKCLILLAQGGDVIKEPPAINKFDQAQDFGTEKFNSKRYIEAPISGNGKAGMYVYECKTCGRTFPSFQALGGHRASHKKPKNMTIFKNGKNKSNYNNSSPLSLELINNNNRGTSSNSNLYKSASFPKIHECSHCGAEFPSGQALGGHMRRHRGVPAMTSTTLSLGQLSPETTDQDSDEAEANKRTSNGLSLDLNLPAPEDDHHNKDPNKFSLASKHQQIPYQHQQQNQKEEEEKEAEAKPALVLSSTPKLVRCHY
ncbi:zinc finger protein ZAT5 [Coffea eugenioides]|uniref:zinc finger protein ZAT5 n=1 Tax=Coffea eugenioides TaxID=49369 RepID=UPI000F61510D|nr:zinc finger protein ZAT5 [Coffea eugenioides]